MKLKMRVHIHINKTIRRANNENWPNFPIFTAQNNNFLRLKNSPAMVVAHLDFSSSKNIKKQ